MNYCIVLVSQQQYWHQQHHYFGRVCRKIAITTNMEIVVTFVVYSYIIIITLQMDGWLIVGIARTANSGKGCNRKKIYKAIKRNFVILISLEIFSCIENSMKLLSCTHCVYLKCTLFVGCFRVNIITRAEIFMHLQKRKYAHKNCTLNRNICHSS